MELNNPNRKRNLNFKKSTLVETNFLFILKHTSRPNPTNHLHPKASSLAKSEHEFHPGYPL
jgi:hypothetical protein